MTGPVVAAIHAGFVDNWADQHDATFDPWGEAAPRRPECGDGSAGLVGTSPAARRG